MHSIVASTLSNFVPPASDLTSRTCGSSRLKSNVGIEFRGTDMAFAKNAQLYGEGESCAYLYKLGAGLVRSCRVRPDGRRQIVAFYVPGDLFGLEVGETNSLSAEAITDARARLIKRSAIVNAAHNEELAGELLLAFAREVQRSRCHILQLSEPAESRVASFLLEMERRIPGIDAVALPIPRQDIADYLDLRIETVSRTMTRIAKAGAIALSNKRKITIRSHEILSHLVG